MSDTFTAAEIETAASAPAETTPDAPAAASTTTSAEPTTPVASVPVPEVDVLNDPGWGQIPPSRRQSILDNARKKARTERETELNAEWETKTGWAKDIDPKEAAVVRDWVRRGNTDPAGLVMDLWQRVQNDPTHGTRLRSEAARILGSRPQQQVPVEDVMPPPDIPTDTSNGEPVVYSAKQLALRDAWLKKQFLTDVEQRLAPYQQDLQSRQQTQELVAMQAQADAYGASTMKSLTDQPGFKEHAPAIRAAYAAMGIRDPKTGDIVPDPQDVRSEGEKLRDAYLQIVVPTLQTAGRQQVVHDLHRKAQASTVNPSSTHSSEPFDYKKATVEEALRYEWEKRKSG